jgi:hypothetical protein
VPVKTTLGGADNKVTSTESAFNFPLLLLLLLLL